MTELAVGTMDDRRHSFSFKIEQADNGSFVASVVHEGRKRTEDDVGALYYVIAVIFIYGCSILMMIASYIRKNKSDRKLNRYLKEMASVRKRERQLQLINATAKAKTITQTDKGTTGGKAGVTEKKTAPKLTFSLDNAGPQKLYSDQVYLDLPTYNMCNSDSDNETSTDGNALTRSNSLSSYHHRSPSQKSILKKSPSPSVVLDMVDERGRDEGGRDEKGGDRTSQRGTRSVVVNMTEEGAGDTASLDRQPRDTLPRDFHRDRKFSLPTFVSTSGGSHVITKLVFGGAKLPTSNQIFFKDDFQVVSTV